MQENTQKQLELQEKIEALSDSIIGAVEVMEAQGIRHIVNSEFEPAEYIIRFLTVISGMLEVDKGGDDA